MLNLILSIIVAFVVALGMGFVIIPMLRKLKAGQHVRDDGPQTHLKKEGTPTMGGIIMVIAIIVSSVIFMRGDVFYIVLSIISMLLFTAVGFIDDSMKLFKKRSLGLRAYQKIIFQVIFSVIIAYVAYKTVGSQLAIPFTDDFVDLGAGYIPFTAIVIIAVVNSVNLTDGLDGLAAGVTFIDAAAFTLIFMTMAGITSFASAATNVDDYNMMIFSAAVTGSCLGFLIFNKYPAKVFMGDTGSFALGGALVMMGIMSRMQLLIPIIGIFFVLSSVSVILQVGSYKLRKKRIFKMAPLHHHFELCGMHETKVVAMYMIITAAVSIASLLLLK